MEIKEQNFRKVEQLLHQAGYTLPELLIDSCKYNSRLLNISEVYIKRCQQIYYKLDKDVLSRGEKGRLLEELSGILFQKSVENLFDVYRNCRTSTNEIDILIRWTESARMGGISTAFSFIGDSFLCECKNYKGPVDVTYVGKFNSLMSVADTYFGVMISWDGISGRNEWKDSKGLIKKIALREKRYIVVLDKKDLKELCNGEKNIFSMLYDKYIALKNETDYDKYIVKHEAEEELLY